MQVILYNDDTLADVESTRKYAEEALKTALHGMTERLTRVEVWVADENGEKGGPDDKRCSMEAHPRGKKPVGVKDHAASIPSAIKGTAKKLAVALEHNLH